jgi:pyrimidine deaminase RibD-like protein
MYTSMEPCSVRLSGKEPCVSRCVRFGVKRVVFAVREPPTFVRCHGVEELEEAAIEVVQLQGAECVRLTLLANEHIEMSALHTSEVAEAAAASSSVTPGGGGSSPTASAGAGLGNAPVAAE